MLRQRISALTVVPKGNSHILRWITGESRKVLLFFCTNFERSVKMEKHMRIEDEALSLVLSFINGNTVEKLQLNSAMKHIQRCPSLVNSKNLVKERP